MSAILQFIFHIQMTSFEALGAIRLQSGPGTDIKAGVSLSRTCHPRVANSLQEALLGLNHNTTAPGKNQCYSSADPERQIYSTENPEDSLEEGLMRTSDQLWMLLKPASVLGLRQEPGTTVSQPGLHEERAKGNVLKCSFLYKKLSF